MEEYRNTVMEELQGAMGYALPGSHGPRGMHCLEIPKVQAHKGPRAPLLGEYTLGEGSGVNIPPYSLGSPPRWPPYSRGPLEVLVGTSQESWENTTSQSLVVLDSSYSSHTRVLLHEYYSNMEDCQDYKVSI